MSGGYVQETGRDNCQMGNSHQMVSSPFPDQDRRDTRGRGDSEGMVFIGPGLGVWVGQKNTG